MSSISDELFIARSKKALYFLNLRSNSDHNRVIKVLDLSLGGDWCGGSDSLQVEIENDELRILTAQSKLKGEKQAHKLLEIALHLN